MGFCFRTLKQYSEAKISYLKSININKADPISHYNLANLYRIIGDHETALVHYNYVILNNPGSSVYVDCLVNSGICYKTLGLFEEAISIYQKVNRVAPSD